MRAPLSPPRGSHDERIDQVITRCYLNFDNANINEHTPLWNADRRRRALDRWPWFVDAIVMGKELLAPEFESHVLEVGGRDSARHWRRGTGRYRPKRSRR